MHKCQWLIKYPYRNLDVQKHGHLNIKRLPAGKKLSVLTGKETATELKKDLESLQKEIKALEKKVVEP